MAQIELNLKDRKILSELDINARQSNSQLAKKVGLSKDVVNYRIKRLEEGGFIKGYYTLIDFYRLGYFCVRVYLKLMSVTPKKESEIIKYLVDSKQIFFVNKLDGQYDLGFGTWVKDIYEFEDFFNRFKKEFKSCIGKEQIAIFTHANHFHRAYLLGKNMDTTPSQNAGGNTLAKHDKFDLEILKLLAKNCRMPITEIAQKTNKPVMTVSFRIRQLEKKKVIMGYRFIFDFSKIGYEYYKVDITLNDMSRLKEIKAYAHVHPNIIYIDQTIGGSDFEFDAEVKNKEQFLQIIDELKGKFTEIREWDYFTSRRYEKLLYYPNN